MVYQLPSIFIMIRYKDKKETDDKEPLPLTKEEAIATLKQCESIQFFGDARFNPAYTYVLQITGSATDKEAFKRASALVVLSNGTVSPFIYPNRTVAVEESGFNTYNLAKSLDAYGVSFIWHERGRHGFAGGRC